MTTRRFGRPSERERKERINAAFDFIGLPQFKTELKPKRERRAPGVNIDAVHKEYPLEKKVLADVLEALRGDPRVAFADRRQSGVFKEGERWIRVGTPGTLDVSGMLIGGRYFEIECKRHGERPDDRQENRIQAIKRNGGVSGCAHSAEEALSLLP